MERKLYSLIQSKEEFHITQVAEGITLHFKERDYYLACEKISACFLYQNDIDMRQNLGISSATRESGYYLAIEHCVSLAPGEMWHVTYGLSEKSMMLAWNALDANDLEETIAARWDTWFQTLPHMAFECSNEKKLYYKCWHTIRNNYYTPVSYTHLDVYKRQSVMRSVKNSRGKRKPRFIPNRLMRIMWTSLSH